MSRSQSWVFELLVSELLSHLGYWTCFACFVFFVFKETSNWLRACQLCLLFVDIQLIEIINYVILQQLQLNHFPCDYIMFQLGWLHCGYLASASGVWGRGSGTLTQWWRLEHNRSPALIQRLGQVGIQDSVGQPFAGFFICREVIQSHPRSPLVTHPSDSRKWQRWYQQSEKYCQLLSSLNLQSVNFSLLKFCLRERA